jgi:hypothetical protein
MNKKDWINSERGDEMLYDLASLSKDELESAREKVATLLKIIARDLVKGYCVQVPDEYKPGVSSQRGIDEIQSWAEPWRDKMQEKKKLVLSAEVLHPGLKYAINVGQAVRDYEDDKDLKKALLKMKHATAPVKAHGIANLIRLYLPEWPGK